MTDQELDELCEPPARIPLRRLMRIASVPLRARFLVESFLTGRHRSPIKGTSPEFAEYRSYQSGDNIRHIDWRLFARSDRLGVKQFEDESQMRLCLALDTSASLRYASRPEVPSKFDHARTLLGAVALLARRQHDAVGLACLAETPDAAEYLRPGSSASHYQTVLRRLDLPPVRRAVSLDAGLSALAPILSRGTIVVLASDFYTEVPGFEAALALLRAHEVEVIGFQVLDPMEVDFDLKLAGRFVDLEEGTRLPLNAVACRAGYLERFGRHQRELLDAFRRQRCDLILQRTDANPFLALSAYLARRARAAP